MMDLLPDASVNARAESPLAHLDQFHSHTNIDTDSISLQEKPFLGHLLLRGNADNTAFKDAIKKVLLCELPKTLACIYTNELSICWVSPDEWLILCEGDKAYKLEKKLREALVGHYSLCNISGGQTVLVLSGHHAHDVLMKSTSYDVADCSFPIGKAVTTTLAKSQAIICRKDKTTWELIVRRSFADYIWHYLHDASSEFK